MASFSALGWAFDELSPVPFAVLVAADICVLDSPSCVPRVRAIIGAVDGPAHDSSRSCQRCSRASQQEPGVSSSKLALLRVSLAITGCPPVASDSCTLRRLVLSPELEAEPAVRANRGNHALHAQSGVRNRPLACVVRARTSRAGWRRSANSKRRVRWPDTPTSIPSHPSRRQY